MPIKTADEVQVGDVVVCDIQDMYVEITVQRVWKDHHGCVLIDGRNSFGGLRTNILANKIVKYLSHANPKPESCCKGFGFHTSDCNIVGGNWYDPNTQTVHLNGTGEVLYRFGETVVKFIKEN